ncbi:M20 family metallo-hydrolase [Pseudogracilibacillus sp. SE30717A]|uniref:M20 family metallo-hydrolase n=1 Tax=Pseudogracilibacillus sp. SE30717A TaxID=3098293 RepID=UPI00300E0291
MTIKEFPLKQKLLSNYDQSLNKNGVSGERLAERLHQIAQIGLTSNNGSNRPGFSPEELAAKQLVLKWMKEAGLTVTTDGAGNVFGRLEGKDNMKKAILSGSHVDSVPNGGHFDGPLGVLAALEVVEAWREAGYLPERDFEVAIFTDEEGSRFNSGFHGSEAVTGAGSIEERLKLTDQKGLSFQEVLQSVGLTVEGYLDSKRDLSAIELFIEVHIEQGKKLEKANEPCGIVTGIAGPCWVEFTFTGEAGHAGNTPMNDRKDALVAASEFIQRVPQVPVKISESAVATIGKLAVKPNGVNVIPGEVSLYVDMRDIYKENQEELVNQVIAVAKDVAETYDVELSYEEKIRITPVPIQKDILQKLADIFHEKGIEPLYLPSGAGHDAMIIGEQVPAAMIFVKSKDGISHRPDEWTDLNDCVQSVHLLKSFIEKQQ